MEGPITIRVMTADGIPQGLKPASVAGFVAKAKALAYLEAKTVGKAGALACLEAKTGAFVLTTSAANV